MDPTTETSGSPKKPEPPSTLIAPTADGFPEVVAFSHSLWNSLLRTHVSSNGIVDYGGFAKDARMDEYLALLSAAKEVNSWPHNERLAYWVNAYNAFTVKLMVDHPTAKSIKDIDGPWKKKSIPIGGTLFDLDHIEHVELRKLLGDERIHFAIVCASFSCPQLWNKAFTAEGIDEQLDDAARRFINDGSRNVISGNPIRVSSIFDWFGSDFTKQGPLIAYLNRYAAKPIPPDTRVGFLDYDWSLNGTR